MILSPNAGYPQRLNHRSRPTTVCRWFAWIARRRARTGPFLLVASHDGRLPEHDSPAVLDISQNCFAPAASIKTIRSLSRLPERGTVGQVKARRIRRKNALAASVSNPPAIPPPSELDDSQ